MRKKLIYWLMFPALLGVACHQKSASTVAAVPAVDSSKSVHFFFPVTSYLEGALTQVDRIPVTPLLITLYEDKRDSTWISKSTLHTLAAPFLTPLIDSARMDSLFTVSSFLDQTINAVTLTYDPKVRLPDTLTLNHWDVYIDPDKSQVQRIYMVKESENQGATVTTQLTWEAGKSFRIRTITERQKLAPEVKEQIVKWDFGQ
ncbi:MAG: hypothetical protein KGM98_10620 [Bacteroidota bacterium]|nr:hypothetical protein [Bacteroidota bacterium]